MPSRPSAPPRFSGRALALLFAGACAAVPLVSHADESITLRLATPHVAHDASNASFWLANPTPDTLRFETYDGGHVHNGLERQEGAAWVPAGLGYCGLGQDGEVAVSPGARQRIDAYVPGDPGTYRIRLSVLRQAPDGSTTMDEVVSSPFQRR